MVLFRSNSADENDRKRVEDLFDATFGALCAVALEFGFVVSFGSDGLWHATREPSSSSSAGVTHAKVSRPTPTR